MGKDPIALPEFSRIGKDFPFKFSGDISPGERGVVFGVILFQLFDSHFVFLLRSIVIWYAYNIPHSQEFVNG